MKNVKKLTILLVFFTTLATSTMWAMRPDFQQQLKERRERLEREYQEKILQERAQSQEPASQPQAEEAIHDQFIFDEEIEEVFQKYGFSDFCNNNNITNDEDFDTNITNSADRLLDEEIITPHSLFNNSNKKKRKHNQEETLHNDIKKVKISANEIQLNKLYRCSNVIKYFPHLPGRCFITEKYTIDCNILEQLLNSDNLNISCESNKKTALHYAVVYRDLETAQRLVEAGANVNALDENRQTPLHLCAQQNNLILGVRTIPGNNNISTVDLLSCASIFLPSEEAGRKRTQMIDLLIESDSDLNLKDNNGSTPLSLALYNILNDSNDDKEFKNLLSTIEVFLKKGALLTAPIDYDIANYEPESIKGIKRQNTVVNLLLKYCVSFDGECKKLMANKWASQWHQLVKK